MFCCLPHHEALLPPRSIIKLFIDAVGLYSTQEVKHLHLSKERLANFHLLTIEHNRALDKMAKIDFLTKAVVILIFLCGNV